MNTEKTLDLSQAIGRRGIQALYTFTPFKIIRTDRGESYSIILAETYHHRLSMPWHSKSVKDEFQFNVQPNLSKTVVQPYELYPKQFTSKINDEYIFERPDHKWKYYPEYMEFSWKALKGGHYCMFGYVLLSSRNDCPIAKDCPVRKGTPCKYYLGPVAYSGLYNVFPQIRKKYELPPDKKENEPLAAIRYQTMPLLTITYVANGSYVAFIDGVQFSPKRAKILRQPLLYLKEGLGFRISNSPAIQFEFNKETLKELVQDRLKNNLILVRWIKLKQLLYMGKDETSGLIKGNGGFQAFQWMDDVVKLALSESGNGTEYAKDVVKAINEAKVDDDLIDFASVLFVHSFSHLFVNWISARYGYGKGDFGYYLEHDKIQPTGLQKEGVRTFIFEAAVGGLGYLKTFSQDLVDPNKDI
ncbi:MAG: hypothetical protein ACP5VS_19220, partial [Desulfomonilaceae bacterium]